MAYTSSFGPVMMQHGTPGQAANIVLSTLAANQNQQEIARRPLKVPDLRQFGVGGKVNLSA